MWGHLQAAQINQALPTSPETLGGLSGASRNEPMLCTAECREHGSMERTLTWQAHAGTHARRRARTHARRHAGAGAHTYALMAEMLSEFCTQRLSTSWPGEHTNTHPARTHAPAGESLPLPCEDGV